MRQEIGGLGGTSGGDSSATSGSTAGGGGSTGPGASVGGTGRPVGATESLGGSGDQRTGPLRDGEDFVCPNCGAEIRVRHAGDSADDGTTTFTCVCGTAMRPEQKAA